MEEANREEEDSLLHKAQGWKADAICWSLWAFEY